MIELYVFQKPNNPLLLNLSSFCAKSEAFLKFAKIEHKIVEYSGDPGKFSKSKLPIIKDNEQTIEDSSFIEEYLIEKYKLNLNDHLSESDKAIGFSFSKLMEEYLYWSILSERWFVDENWFKLRELFFGTAPKLIRPLISNMVKKNIKKSARGHGMGRHSQEEIHKLGKKCIKSVSDFLANKKFLLGEQISTYDISCYAVISNVLHCELNPKLQRYAQENHSNLNQYITRVSKTWM